MSISGGTSSCTSTVTPLCVIGTTSSRQPPQMMLLYPLSRKFIEEHDPNSFQRVFWQQQVEAAAQKVCFDSKSTTKILPASTGQEGHKWPSDVCAEFNTCRSCSFGAYCKYHHACSVCSGDHPAKLCNTGSSKPEQQMGFCSRKSHVASPLQPLRAEPIMSLYMLSTPLNVTHILIVFIYMYVL